MKWTEHRPDTSEPGNWCICGGRGQHHHNPGHFGCGHWCTNPEVRAAAAPRETP